MRYLLLFVATLLVTISSFPSVHALSLEDQNIVDRVITRWHARQPASLLASRTRAILVRVNDIQKRPRITPEAGALLSHIEFRLTNILNALEDRPLIQDPMSPTYPTYPTTPTYSASFPSTIAIPDRFDTNPLLIAGTTSPLFWEIKYSIGIEPMIITDLFLQSSRDAISNRVREFALYDENGVLVATTVGDGRNVDFTALNLRREPGSYKFYLALLPYSVDDLYSISPVNFTLSLRNLYAEGVYSHNTVSPSLQDNISPSLTISPVGIGTVQFINTRNGYTTDSYLSSSETTLGIVEITTPNVISRYDQNIVLDTLTVRVSDNTIARQVANNLRIERLDNQSYTSLPGVVQGNTVTFQLASLGNNIVEQGNNIIFRLLANIPLDSYSRESVQLSIGNLKNGGITYHLEGNNEQISTIQQWSWEVFGQVVSD